MSKITDIVTEIATPVAEKLGLELWDMEFIREGGRYVLRVYIDREDGVSLNDCEAFSRALDPLLDEADPIEESYVLSVSSAGVERVLKHRRHFERFIGSEVRVRLYKAKDGAREHTGVLASHDGKTLVLADEKSFDSVEIAKVWLKSAL